MLESRDCDLNHRQHNSTGNLYYRLAKTKPFVSIDIVIVYILGLLLLLFVLLLLTLQLLNSFLTLVVVKEGVLRFLGNRLTSGKTTSRRPLFPRG